MNLTIADIVKDVMPNAVASGLFVSLFSAFAPSTTLELGGEAQSGHPVAVPSVQNVPCMIATPTTRVQATELKTAPAQLYLQVGHVLLSGYYPQIPTEDADWNAVITDANGVPTTWDILGAEPDSQAQMTRVSVRIAQE